MDSPVSFKKQWVLTQQAFDGLLASFDADRERAGQKYESLRLKLIKYFEWRGAAFPDSNADETINRVARKIEAGEQIHNLDAYFYGVARLIFIESLKAQEREQQARASMPVIEMPLEEADLDSGERRTCLDDCLQHLPEESRALIIEYYQEEKGKKIERRKSLAARLGIPLNALRIRACRIRAGLETCVHECMERHS